MSTASHHAIGSDAGGERTWVLVIAGTGWAVLTTVAVLLATGTWSIGRSPVDKQTQTQNPGPDQNNPGRSQKAGRTPVPRQRTPDPGPRIPTSRADQGSPVYARSPKATIPRQPTAEDR